MTRAARAALLLGGFLLLGAAAAHAATEEFSTFDVEIQEEDDESLLDHVLTRPPAAWRDGWEHAPQALRTSQGCLTSGQWFIDTDLKVRASMGKHARFRFDLTQRENDALDYQTMDFTFQALTPYGAAGFMFRPTFDKSRQDIAFSWELGADTTAWQAAAVFGVEDMFNNLWAFRQTRVGNEAEPYEVHPYEPALRLVARQPRWRAEVGGRWLTPSRKSVSDFAPGSPRHLVTLWGTYWWASLEARALGTTFEASANQRQARSTDRPIDLSDDDQRTFRRRWSGELAARRPVVPRLTLEARWLYQDRDQNLSAPIGPRDFGGLDRLIVLETTYALTPTVEARLGGMFDRVAIAQSGASRPFSYGTRNESRAFVGVTARFDRVSLSAVEGIELDPEPYDVWGVHDKGFLHLQATF